MSDLTDRLSPYTPTAPPADTENLRVWLEQELRKIQQTQAAILQALKSLDNQVNPPT